jgi:hypothetical protein
MICPSAGSDRAGRTQHSTAPRAAPDRLARRRRRRQGALRASVLNHMDCSVVGKGPRVVYTPSPAEWDAAFASL